MIADFATTILTLTVEDRNSRTVGTRPLLRLAEVVEFPSRASRHCELRW